MKQLIVMVATIMLGIAIGVMVMGFTSEAEKVKGSVTSNVDKIVQSYTATDAGE